MSGISGIWDKMVNLSPTAKIATSLILKDVVGCVMYTSTARKNKQYTPEKRADVANYDLANGVINILMQIALIKPIEALMTKFSNAKIVKNFFHDYDKRLASKDYNSVINLLKEREGLVKGSVAFMSVVICQYIIKRFIAPYLSMPAGEKSKEIGLIKPKIYEGETYERSKTNPVPKTLIA